MLWMEREKMSNQIKTVTVNGGNEYAMVKDRLKAFKELPERTTVNTDIVSHQNGQVVFKASLFIDGNLIATGHALEDKNSSRLNDVSYLEVCETSALGRALANAGFLIDGSVASAEEVERARQIQSEIDEDIGKYANELREAIGESDEEAVYEISKEIDKKTHSTSIKKGIFETVLDKQEQEFVVKAKKNQKEKIAKESAQKFAESQAQSN